MIIAVDGPAASGKGTLAKRLAAHYDLAYLDTGRTYRAVALELMRQGAGFDDQAAALEVAQSLDLNGLNDGQLGSAEAGEGASKVAVMPELREVLVARQRAFAQEAAAEGHGAVLDGRDIATVVCPEADVKLYVTASVAERARRRALELFGTADAARTTELAAALEARDARDAAREAGPMRRAEDATLIDTSTLSPDQAFHAAVVVVDRTARRVRA